MRNQKSAISEMQQNDSFYKQDSQLMGLSVLIGDDVCDGYNEKLGVIKEIIFNNNSIKICYAILSYVGNLGADGKLYAVPWQALTIDNTHGRCVLNMEKSRLENAPSFDQNKWPNMNDEAWADEIHSFYGTFMKRSTSLHSGM